MTKALKRRLQFQVLGKLQQEKILLPALYYRYELGIFLARTLLLPKHYFSARLG